MVPYYYTMLHNTKNNPQEKISYVVQSYFDQNNSLVSQNKFQFFDGQPENIQNLNCDEIKHLLIQHGLWPQYIKRIKNLEKVEQEFWNLYHKQVDSEQKLRTLENIANMQSVISNFYVTAKEFLIATKKGELQN